jgi:apolipoprotein N-acyltransferase
MSFPPVSWWWAAVAGAAALFLAVRHRPLRAAAGLGYLYGLGLFVPMLAFLRGIGVDAWLVVAGIESLWFALLAAAVAVAGRHRWWPIAVPFVWISVEWLRDRWPFGGFPWGRLAFGQADGPLLPLAAWGGAPLVTVATLAAAAGLATLTLLLCDRVREGSLRSVSPGPGVRIGAAALLAMGGPFALAAVVCVPTAGQAVHGPAHVVVAAVQGNVPRLGLDAFAQARAVTVNHLVETERLAADVAAGRYPQPAFVVWPENASDQDPFHDPQARQLITRAVSAVGVPIVVGAVLDGPDSRHVQNTAIVWTPAGPGERYVKRHLVPFGEYLPFRSLLTRVASRFTMIGKDFAPGSRPGLLTAAGVRFADVICFEVADDGVVRDAVDAGGRLLVVQTNNATYEHRGDSGREGETAQQLQMSRLRAVEHGRAVVVVATSGVSAVIGPSGRVEQRSGVFTPAVLVADLPLRDARTVADTLGPWPERVAAALGALAVAYAALRRRRPTADGERAERPVGSTTEMAAQA